MSKRNKHKRRSKYHKYLGCDRNAVNIGGADFRPTGKRNKHKRRSKYHKYLGCDRNAVNIGGHPFADFRPTAVYLLLENGSRFLLEDGSGDILLENSGT